MDTGVEDELDVVSGEGEDAGGASPEMLRPVPDLRLILAALVAIGVAYYFGLTRLIRGDLLNSYAFLSGDGLEWLVEGLAVARWLDGVAIPELPIARGPGFIAVTFFDYLIGANGYFIFAVISFSIFAGLAVILLIARWGRVPAYQAGVVVLVLAVSPVGFSRVWLLSDQMASALFVLSVVALYPYATRRSWRWLAVATLAAGLGGATQLYGLVGFLVVAGWCLAISAWRRKPDFLLGGAILLAMVLAFGLVGFWLNQIPHVGVPDQLALIKFNFNMLDFYSDAWTLAFAPLLPLLGVLAAYRWRDVVASPLLSGYWLAVLVLLMGTFLYQFEDFRFTIPTSLMMGVAIMATLPGERPLPWAGVLMASTAVAAAFVGLLLAPQNYVHPELSTVEFNPERSFVGRLVNAEPKDRFRLDIHCQSDQLCDGVPFRQLISGHERAWFQLYRYLLTADSSMPVELYEDGIYEGRFEQRNTNDCCETDTSLSYGLAGDRPVAGDWDGLPAAIPPDPKAGTDTPGVFRGGTWVLQNSNLEDPARLEFDFGRPGDLPVVGDWDGDGIDTIGLFRNGVWMLRNTNSAGPADLEFEFGQAGDVPVVGDWDGDGIDSVGVFQDGHWMLRDSNTSGRADLEFDFGGQRDRPVAGDWDGDGTDTIGAFAQGEWKLRMTNTGGEADLRFEYGAFGDLPIVGDWDDSGVDTIGIAR